MIRNEINTFRKVAVFDNAAVHMQRQKGEIRFADDGRNQRVDDIGDQGVDDPRKRGADHNSDGKIDHIAAQDESREIL